MLISKEQAEAILHHLNKELVPYVNNEAKDFVWKRTDVRKLILDCVYAPPVKPKERVDWTLLTEREIMRLKERVESLEIQKTILAGKATALEWISLKEGS